MSRSRGVALRVLGATEVARPWIGLTFLIPGAPQWVRRRKERALWLFGSFATSMGVAVFAWGTRTGLALLAFAYLTHVVSAAEAIRQWTFPGFGRWTPTFSASAGLAVGCYGPLLLVGSVFAWPGLQAGENAEGYLIDRSAYRARAPESGDRVWLGGDGARRDGYLGEVVAKPGQNVEWSGQGLGVNGRRIGLSPFRQGQAPLELEFQVPEGELLVASRTGDPLMPSAWEFVRVSRVEGRAWAKLYPVWDRRLLH